MRERNEGEPRSGGAAKGPRKTPWKGAREFAVAVVLAAVAAVAWEVLKERNPELAHAIGDFIVGAGTYSLNGAKSLALSLAGQFSQAWPLIVFLVVTLCVTFALGRRGSLLPHPLAAWPISIGYLIARHQRAPRARKLVKELLYKYARQEEMQIRGRLRRNSSSESREPRNRIYTSFVSYSELVDVIVNQRRLIKPTEEVVCFATISMPLPQWFNNQIRVIPTRDGDEERLKEEQRLPYRGVHREWNDYLKLMHELASTGIGNLGPDRCKIYRLLNVYRGTAKKGPFFPEGDMWRWGQTSILLPCNNLHLIDTRHAPEPLSEERRRDLLPHIPDEALRTRINRMYATESASYIIVPDTGLEALETPVLDCRWRSVSHAFWSMFAPGQPGHPQGFVNRIDDDDLVQNYQPDIGLPNDMFLVGVRALDGRSNPDWLIYLAGTTDEGYQMVRLEYGTQLIEDERIGRVQAFANRTLQDIQAVRYGQDRPLVEIRDWRWSP